MKELNRDFYYVEGHSLDCHTYHEGKNLQSYKFLGCHPVKDKKGKPAHRFAVWAPNAKYVNLVGDFNEWDDYDLPLERISGSGIWGIVVYGVEEGDVYKYRIVGKDDSVHYKADPYAFHAEVRPATASKVFHLDGYKWNDSKWMKRRKKNPVHEPMSIYEVNLSSWKKKWNNEVLTYEELADELVEYVADLNFTHVELMPITEYPYDGSWGYQVTGYYAPTSRFGNPHQLMHLIDRFHQKGIGVLMDWVPVHFCRDAHGLRMFDGSPTYEKDNAYLADNPGWGTTNFDYYKPEVRNFLISSALYWYDYYHIDGMRVDAVSAMLYLDYGGKHVQNEHGGNENYEAIHFLQELNSTIKKFYPKSLMIAEESTAWEGVSRPVEDGGLGFDFKWNMGWMHDTLEYFSMDPLFRKDHMDLITFSFMYCFSEKYILPFSHDEVVHMKGSMLNKMPGSYEEKFAGLRMLYAYWIAHPGKKLLFMGQELGTFDEWNEWGELAWNILEYEPHRLMQDYIRKLNKLYQDTEAFYALDSGYESFEWVEHENAQESVFAFERIGKKSRVLCVFNATPVERKKYPLGVHEKGNYSILMNSQHRRVGGPVERNDWFRAKKDPIHYRKYRIEVDLPPLSALFIVKKEKNK